ncbi:MAG TPA: class I SAM-dependent methyltransferase [Noviherbaspirillum sp.]|nr:class I SAM-dependent methyltransferase [Noviherbaspirillum sp.]
MQYRNFPLSPTPALRALAIQGVSFVLALVVISAGELVWGDKTPLLLWALLQGASAAALSRLSGLASWWVPIQLLFPAALLGAQELDLPPVFFLCLFVFFLALYWTTFRTQVPFYPSGRVTWAAIAELLPAERPIRFVDIGSGLGGLVLHLSERRPESRFVGVELAPLPWLLSCVRAFLARSRARFIRGDYLDLDFAEYDIVFAFLSPAAMPALWRKACTQMPKGALLLSYEFPIPGVEPDIVLPPDNRGAMLFGWRM